MSWNNYSKRAELKKEFDNINTIAIIYGIEKLKPEERERMRELRKLLA